MPDLLLTHGYFLSEDEKEQQIMKPYPTLGLLYNSAYLRRAGFTVEIFDSTFKQKADLAARLAQTPGGVLGIYTNLMTRKNVVWIMAEAKRHRWTVICGGPESANYPAQYLAHGADIIVVGEGEITLSELLPALARGNRQQLHDIHGLVFYGEGETGVSERRIIRTPERAQISDIGALPWPDRANIEMSRYVEAWRTHHGMGSVNLITGRGCPYKCKWCSHAVFGYSHRRRNPLDCVAEVQHIVETYRPDQLWYADDVFTINHRWLYEYAAELKRRGLHLPFETISRADRLLKDDVLATLASMGCYRIWIGSESGSQRILDAMQRGVTVEQVQWATHAAQHHGIEVGMFLMWGYDGEQVEDIEATIEHVKRANPNVFFTTVAYPIKNTPYFAQIADSLRLDGDWAEVTDRDYVVRGRHTRQYYRFADQWLRHDVAAHRLADQDAAEAQRLRDLAQAARADLLAVAADVEA